MNHKLDESFVESAFNFVIAEKKSEFFSTTDQKLCELLFQTPNKHFRFQIRMNIWLEPP